MPAWKALLKRPLSIRKNKNSKTKTTTEDAGKVVTVEEKIVTENDGTTRKEVTVTTTYKNEPNTIENPTKTIPDTTKSTNQPSSINPPSKQTTTPPATNTLPHADDERSVVKSSLDPVIGSGPIVTDGFVKHLDLSERDFSRVDKHARATPSNKTSDIKTLSHYLTSPFDDSIDKLRAIYTWIAENITYNVTGLFSGDIRHMEATEVLKERVAVCDGYAELVNALAKEAGIDTWKISGKAKGAGYAPGADLEAQHFGHAWNATCINGEYLLVDSCWGAGNVKGPQTFEKRFEPFYFLVSPVKLVYSHLARHDDQQYLEPPMSKEKFISLPFVKPPYFTSGLSFIKQHGTLIEVHDDVLVMEIERRNPDEKKALHATLDFEGKQIPAFIQRLAGHGPLGGRLYRLRCEIPKNGEGKLNIFVLLDGNKGPLAAQIRVKNHGQGKHSAPFVQTFSVPFSFTIIEPIHANIKYNSRQKFELTVFDQDVNKLPTFCLFTPDKDTRDLQRVSHDKDGSVTLKIETDLDQKGKWNLVYLVGEEDLNFIAQYNVE